MLRYDPRVRGRQIVESSIIVITGIIAVALVLSSMKTAKQNDKLVNSVSALQDQVKGIKGVADRALLQNATLQAVNDSLRTEVAESRILALQAKARYATLREALPQMTPAECSPFSEALSACDEALKRDSLLLAAADSSAKVSDAQIRVTAGALSLVRDSLGVAQDSLASIEVMAKQARCTYDLGIFEVGCIGRTEALILGVVLGAGGVLWLR